MQNGEAIQKLNVLKERITSGVVQDNSLLEAIDTAIKSLENAGCGCSLCLAHNNMKCPKVDTQKEEHGVLFDFPKDKCPKCKSENLKIDDVFYDDDDGGKIKADHYDAHCNDCGWDFLLVEI